MGDNNMERKKIKTPLTKEEIEDLRVGDIVLLSGTIYTARDAAHKRMIDSINKGDVLPFQIDGSIIYYAGPSPTRPGHVIGSIGPTTSGRMDSMTVTLLEMGLGAMIGKGKRSPEVIQGIVKYKSIYLAAIGGAGALISKSVKSQQTIAYEDLGPEAIVKLEVEDFPLIVAIDSAGNSIYER